MNKLSIKEKKLVRKASRANIEDYFVSFLAKSHSMKWLYKLNRYRCLCIERYEKELKNKPVVVNDNDLVCYISASAPTHVIDGWSYLGRAVDATLRGDTYAAIHLGYYAELRAAMGILACEGIGIFSRSHPIVDKKGRINHLKRSGTHKDIWPILKYWATLSGAEELLDDLVQPNSIRLSDWLKTTKAVIPIRAVAQYWLKSWGLDLAIVGDDHNYRNLASYRPSELRLPKRVDIIQQTSFIEELWQLFEPSTARRFPKIENVLLRIAHRKWAKNAPTITDLQKLGFSNTESKEWINYLIQKDDPNPICLAEKQVCIEDPTCHQRIISRAALLLYFASAAARRLLINASYSLQDLQFWWSRHGEDRALWDTNLAPGNLLDLWSDISDAIKDSAQWRSTNLSSNVSFYSWRKFLHNPLINFGGFELVGIWALIP